ncbi:MAG: fibronectin type III domain-containing protein [Desulfuromusa sp.]|nr:fibronectin type III domain-containing protein [Desulfuromusa sp.]
MPQVIPIVAGAVLSGAGYSATVNFVVMAVASLASGALAASQARREARKAALTDEAQARQHIIRSSTSPRRLVYGEVLTSGTLVFVDSTGDDNQYCHMVIAMAGHEVEEIGDIYLDNELLDASSSKYNYVTVNKHLGTADQVADPDLLAASNLWTDNHRLRGIAYIYIRLTWPKSNGNEVWPTGLPQVRAVVKGKNDIFDPRTSTAGYSNNWALCTRDYLAYKHGLNCNDSEIDDDLMITAANISDELVEAGELTHLTETTEDWQFKSSNEEFTAKNATLTVQGEFSILAASATDPQLLSPVVSFSGDDNRYVQMKIRRVVGTSWDGRLFYSTAGHGFTTGYYANLTEIATDGEFHFLEADMHDLTVGGTDWEDNTITGLRFDFDEPDTSSTYIEWIQVGERPPHRRYSCNGTIELDNKPAEIIDGLLTAGVGSLCYSQGVYKLTAGAYTGTVGSLDESNLRGSVKVRPRPPRAELANGIRGTFISPGDAWQPVDFPQVSNDLYVTQDGSEEIWHEIDLPFTTDAITAQRIAKIHLERSRQAILVEFPANYSGMVYLPGDVINLSIDLLGFVNKEFRIIDWRVASDGGGVDLTLQEEAAEVYDWNNGEATRYDPAPDTSLPNPMECLPPTNLQVDSGDAQLMTAGDGTILARMAIAWTAPTSGFITGYEVEWQLVSEATWQSTPSADESVTIGPVGDGERYNIRVRAVNSLQVRSPWLYFFNHTVVGKTLPPSTPSTFLVSRQPDGTREFNGTYLNKPADFAGYRIYSKLGNGQTLPNMDLMNEEGLITALPFESNQLAAGAYTFALTAVDTTGLESAAIYIETTLADPRIGSVAYSEYPASSGWPGTKTDCAVNYAGALEAISDTTWEDLTTWDAFTGWNDGARSPIVYEHTVIDLGFDLIFTPLISMSGFGTPTYEIQWAADGGSYGGWVVPQLVTARYLKVRCSVAGAAPLILALNILLSAEVITEEINDLDTSTLTGSYRIAVGDVRLPVTKTFTQITQIQLALQSVGAGWTWEIVDKDVNIGPRIRIYNGSGILADATIDAFLRGL